MINPHAVKLTPETFDTVLQETNAHEDLLEEVLKEEEVWYVIFWRDNQGMPHWLLLVEEEFQSQYETPDLKPFERGFHKLAA